MIDDWWRLLPAVSTTWRCGTAAHELRWEAGELVLVDHADATAEATLGALGGSRPRCLRLADAWHERRHDPLLLTLGRRPGEADIGIGSAPKAGARLADSEHADARDRLLLLFALPAPFIDRLVLTAAAHAATRWQEEGFRRRHGLRLGAALAARATPALRRVAATIAGPEDAITVQAVPAVHGGTPALHARRTADGLFVSGALPLSWISEVWGAGISEPDGRMVLGRGAVSKAGEKVDVDVEVAEWRALAAGEWEAEARPGRLRRLGDDARWSFELTEG